jgi:hypothetical protein
MKKKLERCDGWGNPKLPANGTLMRGDAWDRARGARSHANVTLMRGGERDRPFPLFEAMAIRSWKLYLETRGFWTQPTGVSYY